VEQQLPLALQVALYTASGSAILVAAILTRALWRFGKQLDRVVTAVEHFEAEITPLARETRAVVDHLRDLSEGAQRVAGIAGGLVLSPLAAVNRTVAVLRMGTTAFLRAFWSGQNTRAT
jgi:hypothetical protein